MKFLRRSTALQYFLLLVTSNHRSRVNTQKARQWACARFISVTCGLDLLPKESGLRTFESSSEFTGNRMIFSPSASRYQRELITQHYMGAIEALRITSTQRPCSTINPSSLSEAACYLVEASCCPHAQGVSAAVPYFVLASALRPCARGRFTREDHH